MSWTTASSTVGLQLSFLVILASRTIASDGFDDWGWRLPFLAASVMLLVSLLLRVRMDESPAFRKLRSANKLSKAPLRDALLDRANLGRIVIAFALCAGMTSMYYMAALYPTFFLTKSLKVDPTTVNTVVLLATALCIPVFPLAGWAAELSQALHAALEKYSYPGKSDPKAFNATKVLLLLALFFASSILTVMTIGPALVEMFPTRIRYTSMGVPYNLATGWVGGLLPTFVFAIAAQTGNMLSGLWYPVGWAILQIPDGMRRESYTVN
ncbi:hypothetical protein [Cupriavidus sp. TMH.W2]|uniref:hypothetical protein n=1 Tax=Cupriavidus sp. TMH.W2 TaxID=3434465 RepID=UPI003D7816A0